MLSRLAAQGLVDGFAAVALAAGVVTVLRQGAASPLRARLAVAFGGQCLFFATRAGFEMTGSTALQLASLITVCVLPLAALVLSEGVLRRHAPFALKVAITAGAAVLAVTVLASVARPTISAVALGSYVVASLAGCVVLLLVRDRASLSRQENASVDALMGAGLVLTLSAVSDFLPAAPVAMSGLGAAAVAFVVAASPRTAREAQGAAADLAVMIAAAAAAALAIAGPLGVVGWVEIARLGAILLALGLAVIAVLSARRRRSVRTAEAFDHALARADTSGLTAFLESLADQPLLAGLRLAEGAQLAEYDASGLANALSVCAVWTPERLADETAIPPRAREELGDLMARTEATHALLVSRAPPRIALLTLPTTGPRGEAEAGLALFQKLAALAAEERPT